MSFLIERISRYAFTATPRVLVAAPVYTTRAFSTSPPRQKTPTESVKDGLKTVDRAVSDKLVDGINVAASATGKAKQTAEEIRRENSGKASELKGEASGKVSELQGEASGKASELKGKAKGAAEQVKQKL